MYRTTCLAFAVLSIGISVQLPCAIGNTPNNKTNTEMATSPPPAQPGVKESYAWQMLRDPNVSSLRLPLVRRLEAAGESSDRNSFTWTGTRHGVQVKTQIIAEEKIPGEIILGFFSDPTWSSPPVQIRSFPSLGEYEIRGIPPGKYYIGAVASMVGSEGRFVGGHSDWPNPVTIERDRPVSIRVALSATSYIPPLNRTPKGLDLENLLTGTVTDAHGRPIPYAEVQIVETRRNRGDTLIHAETNVEGKYYFDKMKWPYQVRVLWREPLPSLFGHRHQYLDLNQVFEGKQTVDFQFEPFPEGTAVLTGTVTDQHGDPLKRFILSIATKVDWQKRTGESRRQSGYRVPYLSEDGNFRLSGLPPGVYRAFAMPFYGESRAVRSSRRTDVTLRNNEVTQITFQVDRKQVFFGRVLFEDGTPAVLKLPLRPRATTSITLWSGLNSGSGCKLDSDGYFKLYLTRREIESLKAGKSYLKIGCPVAEQEGTFRNVGKFPFDLLSKERSRAETVKVAYQPWMEKPRTLISKSLPELEEFRLNIDSKTLDSRSVLICFWNMDQRPSRHCIRGLAEKADELAKKGVVVLSVHSSAVESDKLKAWTAKNKIAFPAGAVPAGEKKSDRTLRKWGVRALPWLILTDKGHIVRAEGFPLGELDAALSEFPSK